MDSRMRMNVQDDRLSALPDDLILKILSFVSSKQVIGTSVLSTRWRHVWTSVPHLNLSSQDISTDFVTHVLSRRNNRVQLSSISLFLHLKDDQINVAQKIMNQAFSLGVQQVNLTCLLGKATCESEKDIEPRSLSLSSSQTQHLTLSRSFAYDHFGHFLLSRSCAYDNVALTSTRELLALTTLHLDYIKLYDGFFSMCPNLENLTLICCSMIGSKVLRICHPRLSNLTLNNRDLATITTNVVTPQLKSLNIRAFSVGNYQISAPELTSLLFRGIFPARLSTDEFRTLEKAQLSLCRLLPLDVPIIISLLQKLHNVKFLSLSIEIIQLLNESVERISHQPSPFAHLKSLRILPRVECAWKHGEETKLIMSTKVKNYLLNSSPEAILTDLQAEHCCDKKAEHRPFVFFSKLSPGAVRLSPVCTTCFI